MFARLLTLVFGTRRRSALVVALWIMLIGVLAQLAPTLADVENNTSANEPPATTSSMRAAGLAAAKFSGSEGVPAIIVVASKDANAAHTAVGAVTQEIRQRTDSHQIGPIITAADLGGAHLRTPDGTAEMVVVPVLGSPSDIAFQETVKSFRTIAGQQEAAVNIAVTGPAGIATDAVKVFSSGDLTLLFGTIALVVILLLAIYRSVVLVIVALASVGIAMRLAQTVGALMADAGWFSISSQTASIMTILLFGVGTDYTLIITARYREALAADADRIRAMHEAMRHVTGAIASSASTIMLAMLALLATITPALKGFGPYLAVGVGSMAVVAFTFTPALILLLGSKTFWPISIGSAARRADSRTWTRVATVVSLSPRRVLAGTLVALTVMTLGLTGYKQTFDFISGFRIDTDSAAGQQLITDAFGPGEIAPARVYVSTTGSAITPDQARSIGEQLGEIDGVARVGQIPRISTDGSTAAFEVVSTDDPYGNAALERIGPWTAGAAQIAAGVGVDEPTALIGGETAEAHDNRTSLTRDTWVVVALVLLIVAGILGLLLRSVLAPLYLVGTLVLSYAATMGVTTFVTLTVLGDSGIGTRVAVYIFVFLVALGVDYNIFIMSRYRQELQQHAPPEAMRAALTRTGGVISSAGLILAATFSVLMTQPIRELFQFGFAMAFGILLDTFVVRPLLVPAIIHLLGDRALWPARPAHPVSRQTDEGVPTT